MAEISELQDSSARPGHFFVACAIVFLLVLFLVIRPLFDPDTWFHLAFGNWVLKHGFIPWGDVFSWTAAGREWISSGWLSSIFIAESNAIAPEGGIGMMLLVAFVLCLQTAICLFYAMKHRALWPAAIVVIAGLGIAGVRFSPRPDIFSQLMLPLLLISLAYPLHFTSPQNRIVRWLPPVIVAIWANLHAGVFVAFPFLAIYAADSLMQYKKDHDRARLIKLIPVALCAVTWMATPYGWRLLKLPIKIQEIPRVGLVYEWMPFFKHRFPMPTPCYFWLAVMLLVGYMAWKNRRKSNAANMEFAWAALLIVLALWQRRQVGILAAALPVALAPSLKDFAASWKALQRIGPPVGAAVLVGILQFTGANLGTPGLPQRGFDCAKLPCVASDFLEANAPAGHMVNSFALGGYLLNRLGPEKKVYIDGRLDVYPHDVWLDLLALEESRLGIDEFLKLHPTDYFVLDSRQSVGDPLHIVTRLNQRQDFALVYYDDLVAVLVRRSPLNNRYISQREFRLANPWKLNDLARAIGDKTQIQEVVKEVGGAITLSQNSGIANAIAAFSAELAGDSQTAAVVYNTALQRGGESRVILNQVDKIRLSRKR